jgi:hypothetical protein
MKKKILVASLLVNMIAGVFVFMAFKVKEKAKNDSGVGYIVISTTQHAVQPVLLISDGNTILDQIDINKPYYLDKIKQNIQTIASKLNEYKSKGYELVSSNGGDFETNYVLVKKQ